MMPVPMVHRFRKRVVLGVTFVAVMIPLAVLLGMQYRWLADLEKDSAVARDAYFENYIEAVASKVEYFYRNQAERALNIPEDLLLQESPRKVVYYFMKREPQGAKILFVVNFENESWPDPLLYDPVSEVFGSPNEPRMEQAIDMALAPWRNLHEQRSSLRSYGLSVEDQDPENRIVLNPLVDREGRVLGVAGMIVDQRFFTEDVLATAVGASLPKFFKRDTWGSLLFSIRDGDGKLISGAGDEMEPYLRARGRIPFIFSDWELAIGLAGDTSEQWARSNFLLNVSLSAVLAGLLIGGLALAFRLASREMKLSSMKSEFVSNVSHELRTPLASVRVFGEFLRLGRVDNEEKVREYGKYIETQCRHLTGLIDNILDFSKIESGVKTYSFVSADIHDLVSSSVDAFRMSLEHKGFTVTFEEDRSGLPELMEIDTNAITRALANLVDNAAKHSKPPATITIGLEGGDGEVKIWVRDEGIGIPKEEHRRIFDRFHRVGTGLVHDVKGSGLGLSIVDHVVRAHGGSVAVASEVKRGSTFTIKLPVQRDPGTAPSPAGVLRGQV
jgi:signal transduction histidine kinase